MSFRHAGFAAAFAAIAAAAAPVSAAPLDAIDFKGAKLTVGSKTFTEAEILGEMLVIALRAGGASVTPRLKTGGTAVNRAALTSGQIDVVMDYVGTGWTVILAKGKPPSDADALFKTVADEDLAKNKVRWVGKSGFNDTFGFAASQKVVKANGGPLNLAGMTQYLKANPSASVCIESEFANRPDGLALYQNAADYKIPSSQIRVLDHGAIYSGVASGTCDFGEVFTTDGRVPALKLSLVSMPGVYYVYNMSINLRDETYQAYKAQFDTLAALVVDPIDETTMSSLNAQVSVEGKEAAEVARAYLVSKGLIAK